MGLAEALGVKVPERGEAFALPVAAPVALAGPSVRSKPLPRVKGPCIQCVSVVRVPPAPQKKRSAWPFVTTSPTNTLVPSTVPTYWTVGAIGGPLLELHEAEQARTVRARAVRNQRTK